MAAQAPERAVVEGVHAGAEGLLLQLRHPTGDQPASHTQQQQQQQPQHSPGASVFPGGWLPGPRAGLRFWRDKVTVGKKSSQFTDAHSAVGASLHARPLTPLCSDEDSPGPEENTFSRTSELLKNFAMQRLKHELFLPWISGSRFKTGSHSGCFT